MLCCLDALVGQRTRRVQGRQQVLDRKDDRALGAYALAAERLDRRKLAIMVGVSRGWMVIGTMALIPIVAWDQWTNSVEQVAASLVAWSVIRPIVEAAGIRPAPVLPEAMVMPVQVDDAAAKRAQGVASSRA